MLYLFKGFGKCSGDLVQEADEWRCFQCGSVYYPNAPKSNCNWTGSWWNALCPLTMENWAADRPLSGGLQGTSIH